MLASRVARASAKGRSEESGLPSHPLGEADVCRETFERFSLWGGIAWSNCLALSGKCARDDPRSKGGWPL